LKIFIFQIQYFGGVIRENLVNVQFFEATTQLYIFISLLIYLFNHTKLYQIPTQTYPVISEN